MLALLKKNMVVIGVVVVAAVLLYYFYSSGSSSPLLSDTAATGESPVSQEILATLGNLRTIKLDNSIFSDPLFVSLSDFGVMIPPAAAGRRNPFAPVGASGAASTPAKTATTTTITTPSSSTPPATPTLGH